MKNLILASLLVAFCSVYANEPAAAPAEKAHKAMTRKEAKAACKSEGKKGKDLKACVKEKLAH